MLFDLDDIENTEALTADVCIVGAGAAGISLARDLTRRGRTVCLLESGGLDFEARTQSLFAGDNLGSEYYELEHARLRFFGGTTNIWGGRCALLDDIDFERRAWVPGSGWPIERNDLNEWYKKAHDELGLGAFDYGEAPWDTLGINSVGFNPEQIDVRLWRFDQLTERFAHQNCQDLIQSPRVKICLHANVVHVQATDNARSIRHLKVRSLDGPEREVSARHYVLACGGIENARLLLASRDIDREGIGNRHDQVGRYFMEHPHGRVGRIHTGQAFELWDAFRKRVGSEGLSLAPVIRLSDQAQAREEALNSAVTFKLQRDPDLGVPLNKKIYLQLKHDLNPTRRGRLAHHTFRALRAWVHEHVRGPIERLRAQRGTTGLYAIVRGEQAPNPASRVQLSAERDALGCQRAALDWRLSTLDKSSVSSLANGLNGELQRLGLGRLEPSQWLEDASPEWPVDATVSNHPIGGYHHMGTTRMSAHPAEGVVDRDCRIHGYENIHIAGSSVFTTSGWANPTLTIIALALRLGAQLDAKLS